MIMNLEEKEQKFLNFSSSLESSGIIEEVEKSMKRTKKYFKKIEKELKKIKNGKQK